MQQPHYPPPPYGWHMSSFAVPPHPPDAVYSAILSTSFLYSAPKAEVTVSVSDFLKANFPRSLPPLIAESPAASTAWLRPLLSLFQMISSYFTEPSFESLFTFPSVVHLCLCSETCGSAGSINFGPIFLNQKRRTEVSELICAEASK